ncbi:hypothetical protein BBJ28_00007264 [Nothophytophthora sp. Chile5]|nr:hypothetical protein BBJ28_00007264 [Nothophytophthora sp. Chile5]
MMSLLEKEARDPVEVLRVKLKDSTSTSLLNSQLLQEIKNDYMVKQDNTKGQLEGFVQAQVDEIERASALLELESPVQQIVKNLDDLGQNCRRMNEELGEKKVSSSGISTARRNLKELEHQIVFYDELPKKFSKQRLLDAFQVLELMEVRRQRFVEAKKDVYLDNQMKPVTAFNTPCSERCKTEITAFLSRRIEGMFRNAESEAADKKQDLFSAILESANHMMMDLEVVQSDVASCFPNEIDVIRLFTSTYNMLLEKEITTLSTRPDVGIAQRLQLVQWIDYYNSEIIKYKHSRASGVLDQTSQVLMKLYLDEIQGQIHTWITNIWKRDEENIVGPQGELQSTRPNDIVNILKSQISIAQEWLSGRMIGCVVAACLRALMEELKIRYESIADDIKKEFISLQLISSTLRGDAGPESNQHEYAEITRQVVKLMRSSSNQESATSSQKPKEKQAKDASLKKLKRFGAISKSKVKDKAKKGKKEVDTNGTSDVNKESTSRESSFTQHDEDNDSFNVQKLDMAAFLGS